MFFVVLFPPWQAKHVQGFAKECAVVTHHRLVDSADKDSGNPSLIPDPNAILGDFVAFF